MQTIDIVSVNTVILVYVSIGMILGEFIVYTEKGWNSVVEKFENERKPKRFLTYIVVVAAWPILVVSGVIMAVIELYRKSKEE